MYLEISIKLQIIVSPIWNGLSNHDAQLLTVKDVNLQLFKQYVFTIRNMHKYSVEDFKIRQGQEQIQFSE
jgi:hypothetical protein